MNIFWKAKTLLVRKQVKLDLETPNAFYFKVKDYDVTHRKKNDDWNCTCVNGSAWAAGQAKCYHVRAVKMWLEEK